jgi:outer membrane scaffolding protein for murein synthesis (MipA/OmpV family)
MIMLRTATALAALLLATPALAQTAGSAGLPDPNDQSDTLTIALGGGYVPDYEGSNDYKFTPFGAVRGRVGGMNFFSRGYYLYLDLLRRPDSGIDFDVGPIVGIRRERVGHIKDDFVDSLPNRKTAIEVGGFAGVTFHGLTNPYDALSFRLDVVSDVGGAHKSTVFTPNIDFGTPLSRRTYVGASLSADFVANRYADYYYSLDCSRLSAGAESINAVVLPTCYNANGGMKNWKLSALINQSITGDLTHGLSAFAGGSYSRLLGSIARSPIVDDRGSRSQWQAALGLAYTF